MGITLEDLERDIARYYTRLGRTDQERAVALERLLEDLGFNGLDGLHLAASELPPGVFARQFKANLQKIFNDPRTKPTGADEQWEYWLEPCSPAALDLVEIVSDLGWSWCNPENNPFLFRTNEQWIERVENTTRLLQPKLTDPATTRWHLTSFDSAEFQFVMSITPNEVSAWVGRLGYGIGLQFDRQTLAPMGQVGGSAYRTALGLAYAWYVDLARPDSIQQPAMTQLAVSDWPQLTSFRPDATTFTRYLTQCRSSRTESVAHWVVAHIRRLPRNHHPSNEKLQTVPTHLKRFMGPQTTWVIGHSRSELNIEGLLFQLRERAFLAEAAGTAYWIN